MAQLINYKTENQIYNDFINLVKASFVAFSLTGWSVRQLNQLFKVNVLKPTVFVSIANNPQRGQQYSKNIKNDDSLNREYHIKQEVAIKFSAARRESAHDDLQTVNSIDVLKRLKSFMQSDKGVKLLASYGYAQYRAGEITPPFFVNDDDNFQLLPSFSCTFVYTDSWQTDINKITKVENKIIGVFKNVHSN